MLLILHILYRLWVETFLERPKTAPKGFTPWQVIVTVKCTLHSGLLRLSMFTHVLICLHTSQHRMYLPSWSKSDMLTWTFAHMSPFLRSTMARFAHIVLHVSKTFVVSCQTDGWECFLFCHLSANKPQIPKWLMFPLCSIKQVSYYSLIFMLIWF